MDAYRKGQMGGFNYVLGVTSTTTEESEANRLDGPLKNYTKPIDINSLYLRSETPLYASMNGYKDPCWRHCVIGNEFG